VAAVLAAGVAPGAAYADFGTDYHDPISAERPLVRPDTPHCTTTVMRDQPFANGYGSPPDTPYTSTVAVPAACAKGPWAMVALDIGGTVRGVQYDRLVQVGVGGVEVMLSSTPEPSHDGIGWHVAKDVTRYAALFGGPQPFVFDLANVTNSTYTGVFRVTATFTFYRATRAHPAPHTADKVLTVSNGATAGSSWLTLTGDAPRAGRDLVFPRNTSAVTAEVYTRGGGACEEFWYGNLPDDAARRFPGLCGTGPYREVGVYVDGRLAGVAVPFPVVYTGGWNPLLWRPVPAPFALDHTGYRVDLTPFVGSLVDGRAHRVELGLGGGTPEAGDSWTAQANLFVDTDHGTAQTRGALTGYRVAPAAAISESTTTDTAGNPTYTTTATRHDQVSGWVAGSAGTRTVTDRTDLRFTSAQALYLPDGAHSVLRNDTDLRQATTTQRPGAPPQSQLTHADYPFGADYTYTPAADGGFALVLAPLTVGYHRTDTSTEGRRVTGRSATDETYTGRADYAKDGTGAITRATATATERYDTTGPPGCYHHVLSVADGWPTADRVSYRC
jgi:hypothetical protein